MSARLHGHELRHMRSKVWSIYEICRFPFNYLINNFEVPEISSLSWWGACPPLFKVTVLGFEVKISVKDVDPPC